MFYLSNRFVTAHFHQQSKGAPFRLPQDHQLFSCLTQAIADGKEKVKGISCCRTLCTYAHLVCYHYHSNHLSRGVSLQVW